MPARRASPRSCGSSLSAAAIANAQSHRFPAAHDTDILKTAATITSRLEGDRLHVTIKNTGAGHNLPTDERHRAVDFHLIVEDESGNRWDKRIDRYRNPYRDEFELTNPLPKPGDTHKKDPIPLSSGRALEVHVTRVPAAFNPIRKIWYPDSTQIAAGEARTYEIDLPEGMKRVTVRFWYRLTPIAEDSESVMIHEKTHER